MLIPKFNHHSKLSKEQKRLLDEWRGLSNKGREKYQTFSKFMEMKKNNKRKVSDYDDRITKNTKES